MAFASTFRLGALVALILCSLVVLGLSAHLTSESEEAFHLIDAFEGLGIATAAITIATVPLMVGVELTRKGAFTSMVVVELTWLGILWVLWLATASGADTIQFFNLAFPLGCDRLHQVAEIELPRSAADELTAACRETQAVAAFGFLGWIILMFYWVFLLIVSITAASHGNSQVWFSSVHDMNAYDSKEASMSQTHNMGTMQSHHTQQV
ncbi:hypothetical protein K435DRAFT_726568 [Dendrothele bispora CBS 962.96]|uniref:MARVEL domain-containing protein n=1 Tax=Dendrothele bispora (strain CBS 962.96) TaxID=1314807 RepID=A0A4S8LR65_DENBC|nr:hypothetical protein K435DRAFT_726568 [Dendrothele bispora CBS 962.96]